MIHIDALPVTAAFGRAAEAIAAGRLAPLDADRAFTLLYIDVGNPPAGPKLSDDTDQLLMEAITLDDWGTEFSADLGEMRRLAFAILGAAAP